MKQPASPPHIVEATGAEHNVRLDASPFPREEFARAPESRRDFVENQQYAVAVAQLAGPRQIVRRVEIHATSPLHDGFQDKRGDVLPLLLQQIAERLDGRLVPRLPEADRRLRQEVLHGQATGKKAVHTGHGVAHGHRVPRVAMIPAANRGEGMLLRLPARLPILDCHLHRHLDGHRAAIGKEDVLH